MAVACGEAIKSDDSDSEDNDDDNTSLLWHEVMELCEIGFCEQLGC